PGLFILTSPRSVDDVGRLPTLDAQGSITKPYFARQLGPVIREAMAARSRLAKRELERQSDTGTPRTYSPPSQPPTRPDDTFLRGVTAMYGGEATGKSQAQQEVGPQDQYAAEHTSQHMAQHTADTPAHRPGTPTVPEPEIPEEATIRDLVSGTTPPAGIGKQPEQAPEVDDLFAEVERESASKDSGDSTPLVASMALAAAQDDTVPMEHLKPPAF